MLSINILSQTSAIILTFVLSIIFLASGIYYSSKHKGLNNYLTANRNIGIFPLTASFVSSALGAWILFGPASAATWGGLGAVIGYALGTAFPLLILITLFSILLTLILSKTCINNFISLIGFNRPSS